MPTRIKICGITNVADAEAAAHCGADLIGLNFYARSPRFITEQQALKITQVLPSATEAIALFVNETLGEVREAARRLGIRMVQLHGTHPNIPPKDLHLIPAFSVRDLASLTAIRAYVELLAAAGVPPAGVLVDAHVAGLHGGTGQVAPWHLLADLQLGVPLILAGGLTPENVAEAIRSVRPDVVDVASGVESSPGKKDLEKLRRFIDAVREAD